MAETEMELTMTLNKRQMEILKYALSHVPESKQFPSSESSELLGRLMIAMKTGKW